MAPGKNRTITFAPGPSALANANAAGQLVVLPGAVNVGIGDVVAPAPTRITMHGPQAGGGSDCAGRAGGKEHGVSIQSMMFSTAGCFNWMRLIR